LNICDADDDKKKPRRSGALINERLV